MKDLRSPGIGHLVDKARVKHAAFDEFFSTADSYFHYSNYILFEVSKSATALCLLLLFIHSSGSITAVLLITPNPRPRSYPGFKDEVKIFEGVIERYCGVPP